MNKCALLLTAATVALLSGPAFADTDIDSATTKALVTSTDGNITVESDGSVTVNSSDDPIITIDSNNTLDASGTLTNTDHSGATGIFIDLQDGSLTGELSDSGKLDMTGTGLSKVGILVSGDNTFFGDITMDAVMTVTGDSSAGIEINSGSVLNGDLTVDGSITMESSSSTTTVSNNVAIRIDGEVIGNIEIGGSLSAVGSNSQGFVMTGDLTGSFTLNGSISVRGTNSATTASDPESGVALALGGDITGGILIAGKVTPADSTSQATIEAHGNAQTVYISPAVGGVTPTDSLTIGIYDDATDPGYSFLNRGVISASPIDPDVNAIAMQFVGASSAIDMTLAGQGFFNSGSIYAQASTDANGGGTVSSIALWFSSYSNVPKITNNGTESDGGTISASLSGETGGTVMALEIGETANYCPSACSLMSIINSGTISASASVSDTTIGTLNAYAIYDVSGSVNNIQNSGTISATATTLDDDSQVTIAAYLAANTSGVTFYNSGTVNGNVVFGIGNDTFTITGSNNKTALVGGDVKFNGTTGGGTDTLTLNSFSELYGAVTEALGSKLDIDVKAQAVLLLTNDLNSGPSTNYNVNANNFKIEAGAALGMVLSQGFNSTDVAFVDAEKATIESDTILNLTFGSFLTVTGNAARFILIDTPLNQLTIGSLTQLQSQVCSDVSFFINNNATCLERVDTATNSQLVLTLAPKSRDALGLTPGTFAYTMYPLVNAALVNDDELGAQVIAAGLPVNGTALTQQEGANLYNTIYASFAPDVTGSSRAIVVSLTDQATGPVAARQRALRMYAGQQGTVTMWGQEFGQRINNTGTEPGGQYRNTGFGFALGLDEGDPDNGRYGGAFAFYTGDTSEQAPRNTKTSSEWYMLTGYTDWRGKGLFFDSQASLGYGTILGKRYLSIGSVSREADSNRAGLFLAGGVTTGVVLAGGGTVFTPQISVDGMTMREDGYTESNGEEGVDLKVEPYYANSLRGYVGASLRQDLNFGTFYFQPEVRAGYRYDVLSDPAKIKASFVSVPLSSFTLSGPDPGKGNLVVGGSLAVTTGAWSIGLNYDYLRSTNGDASHTGTLMLTGRI